VRIIVALSFFGPFFGPRKRTITYNIAVDSTLTFHPTWDTIIGRNTTGDIIDRDPSIATAIDWDNHYQDLID